MRPVLTAAQAAGYAPDEVLHWTGRAGAETVDVWEPWASAALNRAAPPDLSVPAGGDVQATVNAAVALAENGFRGPLRIALEPGRYDGPVILPALPGVALCLYGTGSGVEIAAAIDAEMPGAEYAARFLPMFDGAPPQIRAIAEAIAAKDKIGTDSTAVLRVTGDRTELRNLSVVNTYNVDRAEASGAEAPNARGQFAKGQHQAVALMIHGADRVHVQGVTLTSYQDTLYLKVPADGIVTRACFEDCAIAGDVDFIFGQMAALFLRCRITSRGGRAPMSWVTAPSTALRAKFGFVFHDCDFVHDGSPEALAGRFKLGRQWFEWVRATPFGVSPVPGYRCDLAETSFYDPPVGGISRKTLESVGKVAILNSRIGPHIDAADPWDSWNGASHPDGSPIWAPRYRPPLYRAGDMLGPLEGWLAAQGLDYGDIDPETPWLAEYGSDGPHM